VRVGTRNRQRQPALDIIDIGLDAVHEGVATILDDGEAVRAEIAELDAFPLLVIDRTIPAQPAAHEGRLPARFVIRQKVRRIGRRFRLAIDAARTEALRPGRVDH
jgi:hypothetical protein